MLWRRWARCSGNNATQLCLPAIPLPYLQPLDTSAQFFELRLEEEYSRGRETMRMDLTGTLEPRVGSLPWPGLNLVYPSDRDKGQSSPMIMNVDRK